MIHSVYWTVYCSSYSFATIFLLSRHYSNSQIGIVFAAAGISSTLLQPAVAAFADRARRISIGDILLVLIGAAAVFVAGRFFLSNYMPMLSMFFILELSVLCTLQPLINALGIQLINRGIEINYGLARGTGSMAYAVASIAFGAMVAAVGADSLAAVSIGLYAALALTIRMYVRYSAGALPEENESIFRTSDCASTKGILPFLARYKKFMLFLAAVSLTFCSHSMLNTYLIQIAENVGGGSTEMGIAMAISAAVELPAMILFGFLVQKIRCAAILKFSLLFFVVKAALTLFAANVWMLYLAQMLQFSSFALFIPASVFYVNEQIGKDDLAKGQAFMTSAITLGGVAASYFGGWLLDYSGVGGMLFTGLICAVLGLALGIPTTEKAKSAEQTVNQSAAPDRQSVKL